METLSPSSSSVPVPRDAATFDEFSIQQSLMFTDSLKDLKNLRSQLYSAAEYFELSYSNDEQKQIVMNTLKDYAVKALVNTVDHLGSMSYKVNGLIHEKLDEVSGAELRVSCIEQRIRTCQVFMDHEGRVQQSLFIAPPRFYKRYIVPGESMPESGRKAAPVNEEQSFPPKENVESLQFRTDICSSLRDRPPSFRKIRSFSPSSTIRARSASPRKGRSPSPTPHSGKLIIDKRAISPLPTSNPLARSGSLAVRPTTLNSSGSVRRRLNAEAQKSFSMQLHAERNEKKEVERIPTKSKSFLKSLLSRRRSKKDEMLYSYIDEY